MNFFNNYIWVIALCAIVFFAIIGFIADKTNFIDKQTKKIKGKKSIEKEPVKEETLNNMNKGLNDAFVNTIEKQEESNEDIFSDITNSKEEEVPSELYEPLTTTTKKEEEVPSELYEPLENTKPVQEEINTDEKVVDFSSSEEDEVWKF